MSQIEDLLAERPWLLCDGATGTNYFAMGLEAGHPPELWNVEHPERVAGLHRSFIEAGADIILTNTFGGNRLRLMLHGDQDRAAELNATAAQIARKTADAAGRPVLVAGSMGPTGGLMAPLGEMTMEEATDAFREQALALRDGGADLLWIETLSSTEEADAAMTAATQAGLPIVITMSFDTGGRTMMGVKPDQLPQVLSELSATPFAFGANCGVGAAELVATIIGVAKTAQEGAILVAKGNCGVPRMVDGEIRYTGTPELMADYARLALDAGARLIGGCCGTTPEHLRAMREALESHQKRPPPSIETVTELLGEVSQLAHGHDAAASARERRRRR